MLKSIIFKLRESVNGITKELLSLINSYTEKSERVNHYNGGGLDHRIHQFILLRSKAVPEDITVVY